MISLYDYLELLKEYEKNINNELLEIMSHAKINFTFESIKINSVEIYDNTAFIDLAITKYNGGKNKIMKIHLENGKIDTLVYQLDRFTTALVFEKTKMDHHSLLSIISLARKYVDFYNNDLSYEKIMRKIRHLDDHLPFYDHEYRENELKILKETMIDKDKLPKFLNFSEKSHKLG